MIAKVRNPNGISQAFDVARENFPECWIALTIKRSREIGVDGDAVKLHRWISLLALKAT